MPYALRQPDGTIHSLHREPESGAEFLASEHPDVLGFLDASAPAEFTRLDADLIRVIEDVVDVLVGRQIIRITDLPLEAQNKLFARKNFRERRASQALHLYGPEENGLVDTDFSGL